MISYERSIITSTAMLEVLVLGAEGSGKSLLIRKLQQLYSNNVEGDEDQSESTIPTVGVDISTFRMNDIEFSVREIGATMASKWNSYIPDCIALLFVIDVSDLGMLASNLVLLYEVLANRHHFRDKPFAILFNKLDLVCDPTSIAVVYNTLRIGDLIEDEDDLTTVLLSGSSLSKESAPSCVYKWIKSFLDNQTTAGT